MLLRKTRRLGGAGTSWELRGREWNEFRAADSAEPGASFSGWHSPDRCRARVDLAQPVGERRGHRRGGAGIAALVPPGQRAFAIRVVEEDIVGGFLQAGDRVDVFVTFPGTVYGGQQLGQNNVDRSKSALLLQDMQVLAVGPALSSSGTDVNSAARTVTVAAPPEALTRLALAGRLGHITLAIRNPSDRVLAPAEVVALEDLRPGATSASPSLKAEAEAERPAGHRITIYSGANQATVTAPR